MKQTSFFAAAPLLGLAALCAGCPSGGAAKQIRSDQPTVSGTQKGAAEDCDVGKSYSTLALDWDAEVRGDLEVAMKEGVAVVAYDCDSIRLLEDCTLDGKYGFIGMTHKEKLVSMQDSDEVKANLPMSGGTVGAGITRGTSLEAAMLMIGKQNASRKRAARDELDEDCAEATHFVRSATVGAFVLATSSAAEGKVAASFFGQGGGAGSSSTEKVHSRDGDVETCKTAKPDANKAPEQCAAVLRLSLKPIKAAVAKTPLAAIDAPSCPAGLVMTDGSCQKSEDDVPHQCEPSESQDCTKQCESGDVASCYILASLLRTGTGAKQNPEKAAGLFAKACEGGHAEACRAGGVMYGAGEGVGKNPSKALAMLTQSCDAGDGLGCVELGKTLLASKDSGDAQYKFRRACYGGEYEGCTWLGNLRQRGLAGFKKNPKMANKFYEKGCIEGSAEACYHLSKNLAKGTGGAKDSDRAAELKKRSCELGYQEACSE